MKVLRFLDENIEKILCVVLLAAMSILIVVQVFFRYALNNSLSWTEELSRYMFIWLIYIGISYGVKMDKHICVDAVYAIMPKKAQPIYALFGIIGFLIFACFAVYFGLQVVSSIAATGQISTGAHIPMQYIYMAPVVGMTLTAIRLIQHIVSAVKDIKSGAAHQEGV